MKRIVVVGAGGHGRSIAEAISQTDGLVVAGFLDDKATGDILGLPVIGRIDEAPTFRKCAPWVVVAIGNNEVRAALHARMRDAGFEFATVVHPRAIVSPSAAIGHGCAIMAGAVVGTEAWLGEGVVVNAGAIVDHHCKVEAFAHLGVGACMAGGAILGSKAWMQAGASLGYGVVVKNGHILLPGQGMQSD